MPEDATLTPEADAAHTVAVLLGCPVAVTPTGAESLRAFLRAFEAEHCFDPRAQPALTAVWLGDGSCAETMYCSESTSCETC